MKNLWWAPRLAGVAALLAACGSQPVLATADDVTLEGDAPLCVAAGNGNLCQVRVYFVSGSTAELTLDPGRLRFRDQLGVQYTGVTNEDLISLTLPASGRALTLWSVPLPPGKVPTEAIWTDADKNIVRVTLGASGSPSPSATSASPTPSPPPTSASPTPSPTPSSPKPTPTSSSPKPKPTKSTSTPPPGGSIG